MKALRGRKNNYSFITSSIKPGLFLIALVIFHALTAGPGAHPASIDKYKAAAEKFEKAGNWGKAAACLTKIAQIYEESHQTDDAIDFFTQSLALTEKTGNQKELASIHSALGRLLLEKKEYDKALKHMDTSIGILKETEDASELVPELLNKGKLLKEQKKYKGAIKAGEDALAIAEDLQTISLLESCYQFLYEAYEKNGSKAKSLQYYKAYSALQKEEEDLALEKLAQKEKQAEKEIEKLATVNEEEEQLIMEKDIEIQTQSEILKSKEDSLREVENINKIKSAEIALLNIEKERKEMAIKEKEMQIRQKDEELKYEQTIKYLVSGILLITAIFGLITFMNYRQKVKDHQLLQQQSAEIEQKKNELGEAFEQIKDKNHKITASITYAERIQRAMLPNSDNLKNYLSESFILFKPRDVVSGDFYWFNEHTHQPLTDDFIITAVDCTGHGVPGAFMSMIGFNLLNEISAKGILETNVILQELHEGVRKALKQSATENRDGMDMALCKIRAKDKVVEYAGAKNPLYYIQNGTLTQIKGDSNPIGGTQKEEKRIFSKHEISVHTPTTFYLFSDGYADQFGGEKGMKFMYSKFKELLLQIHEKPMDEQRKILDDTMEAWKGDKHKQIDDILVIGFKIS